MRVGRTFRAVHDRHRRHDVTHRVCDLAHARLLDADEVVDAILRLRRERSDDPVGQVLDVDELPRLPPVARDRERLAFLCTCDEGWHDRCEPGARAVRDAEAQDRVRAPYRAEYERQYISPASLVAV